MNLMDKVRQVGESYELNKYKALNKTIELDASLANERLFATKLRLNQVSSMNDKLNKQLRLLQQQYRSQEQKLLLTETMLRQFIESRDNNNNNNDNKITTTMNSIGVGSSSSGNRLHSHSHSHSHHKHLQDIAAATKQKQLSSGGRLSRLSRVKKSSSIASVHRAGFVGGKMISKEMAANRSIGAKKSTIILDDDAKSPAEGGAVKVKQQVGTDQTTTTTKAQQPVATSTSFVAGSVEARQVNSSSTQTQTSRTKMIINDLRQRLNLVGNKSE